MLTSGGFKSLSGGGSGMPGGITSGGGVGSPGITGFGFGLEFGGSGGSGSPKTKANDGVAVNKQTPSVNRNRRRIDVQDFVGIWWRSFVFRAAAPQRARQWQTAPSLSSRIAHGLGKRGSCGGRRGGIAATCPRWGKFAAFV